MWCWICPPKLHQHNQGLAAPWLLQRVPLYLLAEDVLFSVNAKSLRHFGLDVIHVISPRQILIDNYAQILVGIDSNSFSLIVNVNSCNALSFLGPPISINLDFETFSVSLCS